MNSFNNTGHSYKVERPTSACTRNDLTNGNTRMLNHASASGVSLQYRGRLAVFIDSASLLHAASQLDITIDYRKLLEVLIKDAWLVRVMFYTGADPGNDRQHGFLVWLQHHGYRVVSKELTCFADGSKKANLDVEIAVDMLSLSSYCDTVLLLCGNGELSYALDAVSHRGVRTELVGLRSMTSERLIRLSDVYIDLESISAQICRENDSTTEHRGVTQSKLRV
ncbi:NYN domain-containing protein [Leptolyngbya sp. AN03gr2]|uniref:LabA-like NYN domain-containing protein n=1 Tax=unclassified Leptolyngbya TaxID=2650499 RepID=UPI003D321559